MHVGVPLAAVLTVIIIVYFLTRVMGVSVRFPLLFACGFMGLFLGLMLPRLLLPKISITGTILIVVFFMAALSVFLAWFFTREAENNQEKDDDVQAAQYDKEQMDTLSLINENVPQEKQQNYSQQVSVALATAQIIQAKKQEDVTSEESEGWGNDEFDPASVLAADLNNLHYDIEEDSKKSYKLPEKIAAVANGKPRITSYQDTFKEIADNDGEIFAVSNVDKSSIINKTETSSAPIESAGQTVIHCDAIILPDAMAQSNHADVYAEAGKQAEALDREKQPQYDKKHFAQPRERQIGGKENVNGPLEQRRSCVTDKDKQAGYEKDNLVSFPPAEFEAEAAEQMFNKDTFQSEIIDFSSRLAQRSEQQVQNIEHELKKQLPKIYEKSLFDEQTATFNYELATADKEGYLTKFEDVSIELVANGHYVNDYANITETGSFFVGPAVDKNDFSNELTIETDKHCQENDLPYNRLLSGNEGKAASKKELEQEMGRNLLPKQVPKSDSFADLLEFAFAQKERANYEDALFVFQMAYDMYADTDYAPLIIAELVNIYKTQGAYDEAINILKMALNTVKLLPARKDLITNIAYLKIIKNILSVNRLDLLPYDEIPDKVKESIEKEFAEWKLSS